MEKRGRIYVPDGRSPWAYWYAFPPVPYLRPDGVLRIYVAFCDQQIVGRVGYIDVHPDDPGKIVQLAERPLLDIGQPGAFDDNGVIPLSLVEVGGELYLYYVGFQLGSRVRYFQFGGLARSNDGGESFERVRHVPVIDRSDSELANRTSMFVLREDGRYRMWYVAGSEWTEVGGKQLPVYNIRHATSRDGIHWPESGEVCIDFADADEHAFGRPWVMHDNDNYRMFFSVRTRSKGYRMGYAESRDGLEWMRKDSEVGIDVSESGWDSEMVAYASIFEHNGRTTMFYNGNGLGRTGFGYATLEG